MKPRDFAVLLSMLLIVVSAYGQFGSGIVFDPTQSGHAIEQINQAEELYTTAVETRNNIISAYNLARQMSSLPKALYEHYITPWTAWHSVSAVNTYGNVTGWVNAANTGTSAIEGYQAAMINVLPQYPLFGDLNIQSQRIIASQAATNDLGDGITESNLETLGTMRAVSEAREADIKELEAATYSADPMQHTDMATLQRINQAVLMQLRAQQDANQVAQAAVLQQMIVHKQQQDALKAAFQDAGLYWEQYSSTIEPLTSGYAKSMSQVH